MGRSFAYRITADQVAPVNDPDWRSADKATRMEVMSWVLAFGVEEKLSDLAKGLDRYGEELAARAPSTVRHRRSVGGFAEPSAPPLVPALNLSRTMGLLTGAVLAHGEAVEFFWDYDPHTHDTWGRILGYHRRGGRRLPRRD